MLTPVRDVDKMKDNLQYMLNDLHKAQEMGREARKTCEIYRSDRVYREWYEYIMQIVNGEKEKAMTKKQAIRQPHLSDCFW